MARATTMNPAAKSTHGLAVVVAIDIGSHINARLQRRRPAPYAGSRCSAPSSSIVTARGRWGGAGPTGWRATGAQRPQPYPSQTRANVAAQTSAGAGKE